MRGRRVQTRSASAPRSRARPRWRSSSGVAMRALGAFRMRRRRLPRRRRQPPSAAPRSSRRRPSCSRCGGRPATQLRSTSTSISLRLGHGGQYAPLDRLANHAAVKHRTVCKLLSEARVHPGKDLRARVPISAQHRTAVTRQLTVLARDRASVSVACTALRSSSRRPASSAHNEFDDETRPPWTMLQSSPAFVALTCSVSLQAGSQRVSQVR